MPVWHEATAKWVKAGRLAVLGVTQEQHADRCRLLAQWKQFDWPILHDPVNVLGLSAVPVFVALDEHGIVRAVGPRPERFETDFLDRAFADDAKDSPARLAPEVPAGRDAPDFAALRKRAEADGTAASWRGLGDALALWGGAGSASDALGAYQQALKREPRDAAAAFRLGVCHRRRFESGQRRPGDFQAAIDAWDRALTLDPNQYVWRRRLQQYGPRLDKPYAFYDWVEQAEKEIKARGDRPVALAVRPGGAEVAGPARDFAAAADDARPPDPDGKLRRDDALIDAEVTVVPPRVRPGQTARVHVTFRPAAKQAHWNNEAEPLRLWVEAPAGWQVSRRLLAAPPGDRPETTETRSLDFEVKAPADGRGKTRLTAYAVYHVCEAAGGKCLFLRRDVAVELEVRP